MDNQEKIDRINAYQNAGFVHELTCGNNSRHSLLIPKEVENVTGDGKVVMLSCPDCDYWQEVPGFAIAFSAQQIQEQKQELISKGFKFE